MQHLTNLLINGIQEDVNEAFVNAAICHYLRSLRLIYTSLLTASCSLKCQFKSSVDVHWENTFSC